MTFYNQIILRLRTVKTATNLREANKQPDLILIILKYIEIKVQVAFPLRRTKAYKKQAPAVRKLPGLRYLLKTDDNHHYIIHLIKNSSWKKQKLSKEAQEIAELYTRLEILKSKQIEGVKTTRYTTDAIRACQGRIRKLLQKVGGIEEIQIKVDDARTLAEYFQRNTLPSWIWENTEKAAGLFKAMQVIFNFSVVVKTLATYYYSKEKRERTNS